MRRIFRDTTAIALGLGLTLPALASAQTLSAADAARVGAERAANMPELARMLDEEIGDGLTADKLVCLMNAPKPCPEAALAAMLDGLELFGIGYSWGGFESLAIPVDPYRHRSVVKRDQAGPMVRLQIGLEDPDDLIADLKAGLARLGRE